MRPIKFRAWDSEANVMRSFSELAWICLDALVDADSLSTKMSTW